MVENEANIQSGRGTTTLNENEVLSVRNVEVMYQNSILALKNISLAVAEGQIVSLLGANGAGKSTLLKAVSSLIQSEEGVVTDGSIRFRGDDVTNGDPVASVHKGIVQVMEGRPVLRHMTVEQNIGVAAAATGANRVQRAQALEEVFTVFPALADLRKRQSGYLSGGQQQMLLLGRALTSKPDLLLLDEPSLGLAPVIIKDIFRQIIHINEELGTSILIVEQNARLALEIAEYGYLIENGRIVLQGPCSELQENDDLMEFYLGIGGEGSRRSYRDVKHYRRRKRWIA